MRARAFLRIVIQFAVFQLAWLACVLGAAHGQVIAGVACVGVVVGLHLALSDGRAIECALIAMAVILGLGWDTAMIAFGVVGYASPGAVPWLAPPWILALWALFATLLCSPLSWLHRRPFLAAALGAVGGPLSYLAAVRLGAGNFTDQPSALLILAVGWAALTPVLTESAHWMLGRCSQAYGDRQIRLT